MQPRTRKQAADQLFKRLMRELFQTETSAVMHCRREAERLPDAAYAPAFRDISSHAERVLQALPDLARREDLPVSGAGIAVGAFFSQARDKVADKLLDAERSYRGTMLGVRHGVDLMRLLGALAQRQNRTDLALFCDDWMRERQPYVEHAEVGAKWFAENPDRAAERPRSIALPGLLRMT